MQHQFFLLAACILITCSEVLATQHPGYLFTTSEVQKFTWFKVPKVGTRTIMTILHRHCELPKKKSLAPFDPDTNNDYFRFAFVRNPWDRVVSCYFSRVVPQEDKRFSECFGKSFDYFVDFISNQDLFTADPHIRLQIALIPINDIDFIGRYENFENDLQFVLNMIGIETSQIPCVNATPRKHYSKYYTEKTKRAIAKAYKRDIREFGYAFESIEPSDDVH